MPPGTRRPLLLLVDDAPANLHVLVEALRTDYEIAVATDGETAMRLATGAERPDLVLLDVAMPGIDGYEVCRRLKASPATRDIPVIFVTARTALTDELRGFRAGGVDYITKPVQLPLVQARVRTHLSYRGLIATLQDINRALVERLGAGARSGDLPPLLYARAIEHTSDAILITDAQGTIVAVNRAYTMITGYTEAESLGQTPRLLRSDQHPPDFYAGLYAELAARGNWTGELVNRRRDGSLYPVIMTITAVLDAQGRLSHYVSSFSDVSLIRQAQERMDYLTWHDPLTGLPNRLLYTDRLRQTLDLCSRDGSVAAALALDIERFRALNEAMGFAAGDAVLDVVAARLRAGLHPGDTLARLAGDEFAVVLPTRHATREAAARHARLVAERLCAAVAEPLTLDGATLRLGLGVGIALFPRPGGDEAGDTLRRAQTARHRAGGDGAGGHTIVFFDERMGVSVERRFRLEQALQHAIGAGELRVYLQSQVDGDGRVTGAEALVRWQHPERGLVPPGEFVPVAEESGLIVALDRWVLGEVVALLARTGTGDHAPTLSVNISPRHFRSPDFVAVLQGLFAPMPALARRLVIELTEGVLIDDPEAAAAKMVALGALGVRFSIDDFGTGYSSLAYLKRLPLHELKIDRSFILDAPHDADDAALVHIIMSIAGHLRLQVVAEGVETDAHAQFLRTCPGVRQQGYLYGRPQPAAEWLAEHVRAG